jgi:hydrogenase expression/formation protein HypE
MRDVFGRHFSNEILDRLDDGAVLFFGGNGGCAGNVGDGGNGGGDGNSSEIVVSTDSFVVTPLEFPGGDIGRLAVCGTVNDVLMMGAVPRYLTCGFIIEAGLEIALLDRICASMALAASEAGVLIVAGDTKVIEHRGATANGDDHNTGHESGMYINTTGIGILRSDISRPSGSNAGPGDVVIVSGRLGDHHACILSARMGIKNDIKSDCAILKEIPDALYEAGIDIHTMRDVTRGGLGTVTNEIATSSNIMIELEEESLPVDPEVRAFCGIMGLDPLYMGNEGKMIVIVPEKDRIRALELIRKTKVGKEARIIGRCATRQVSDKVAPPVVMKTKIGGTRRIDMLSGEGLPRIC